MDNFQPFDIVKTPLGAMAMVTETNRIGNVSICYFENTTGEKNAWWTPKTLTYVTNLTQLLAMAMAHPFGQGASIAEEIFERKIL